MHPEYFEYLSIRYSVRLSSPTVQSQYVLADKIWLASRIDPCIQVGFAPET